MAQTANDLCDLIPKLFENCAVYIDESLFVAACKKDVCSHPATQAEGIACNYYSYVARVCQRMNLNNENWVKDVDQICEGVCRAFYIKEKKYAKCRSMLDNLFSYSCILIILMWLFSYSQRGQVHLPSWKRGVL